jgi:undecaprenyl-diphosphatase
MKKILKISHQKVKKITGKALALHKMEPLLFPVLLVLFFVLSSLGEIVDDIMEREHEVDAFIYQILGIPNTAEPQGPEWLQEVMRDFSSLGGIAILSFLTIAAALYLFILGKKFKAWYLLGAVISGTLLTNLLKAGFDRPRPELALYDTYVFTASFPSGHSMMAAVVYLTLGSLLAENENRNRIKIFILLIAVVMAFLVGVSRIYVGAHWVSDVLAGWLAGSAWALLFWLGERYLIFNKYIKK